MASLVVLSLASVLSLALTFGEESFPDAEVVEGTGALLAGEPLLVAGVEGLSWASDAAMASAVVLRIRPRSGEAGSISGGEKLTESMGNDFPRNRQIHQFRQLF